MSLSKPIQVESFRTFTKDEVVKYENLKRASATATLLYLYLTLSKFPKADLVIDKIFDGDDDAIESILKPIMHELLDAMGGAPKPKKGATPIDIDNFHILCDTIKNRMAFLTEGTTRSIFIRDDKLVDLFNKFSHVIATTIAPMVTRVPIDDITSQISEFNNKMKDIQNVNPLGHLLRKGKSFFGLYVNPTTNPTNGSGHITIAYTSEEKLTRLPHLATVAHFKFAEQTIEWKDDSGKIYTYLPALVIYDDGTTQISHVSIHVPDGGELYGLNHVHQKTVNPLDYKWMDESHETMVLSFTPGSKNEFLVSFDMDKTLFTNDMLLNDKGNVDLTLLHDVSRVQEKYLTEFGRFVKRLGIPFQTTTSRNSKSVKENADFLRQLQKIFPNCIAYSSGKSMGRLDGDHRERAKAEDKKNRVPDDMVHIDDQSEPLEAIGFGGLVVNGGMPVHYHRSIIPGHHTHFGVHGRVGTGKTTAIKEFFKKENFKLPGSSTEGPFGIVCAADASDPDDKLLPIGSFARQYPGQDTCLIHDTTGNGRDKTMPTILLAPELTWLNFAGCMTSLMSRQDHPNLNGPRMSSDKVVFTPPIEWEFNTNDMSLTDFINYVWHVNEGNTKAFTDYFARVGQSANFATYATNDYGNILVVHTTYREGMQKFTAKWGRQNRNCFHFLYNGTWYFLKLGLEAGMENKPDTHKDLGDVIHSRGSATQADICDGIFTGKDLPDGTTASFKRDGALMQTTLYQGDPILVDVVYQMAMCSDAEFAKILVAHTYKMMDARSFIFPSSNGTLFTAPHMYDYMLTAIAWKLNQNDNLDTLMKGSDVMTVWEKLAPEFAEHEMRFWNSLIKSGKIPDDVPATHQMEAGCPNRATCTGTVHVELTIGYSAGFLSSLGVRYMQKTPETGLHEDYYVPHFDMEKEVDDAMYDQPRYWRTSDTRKLMQMLTDLQRISVDSDYTAHNFFEDHPPDNLFSSRASQMSDDMLIDHEGFVLLVKVMTSKGYDYGKLKTLLYYIFHKIRDSNMDMITALANSKDIPHFPTAGFIRDTDNTLRAINLSQMFEEVCLAMTEFMPTAPSEDTTDRKLIGPYTAYWKKLNDIPDENTIGSSELASWAAFMISNSATRTSGKNKGSSAPSMLVSKVHDIVLRHVDMTYISNYRSLLGRRAENDRDKTYQKRMDEHLGFMCSLLTSPITDETMKQLRHHMIMMRINMPVIEVDSE